MPSSTTADLLSEDQKRDMHSRCRETDTHFRGEANGHRWFRTGTQTDTVQPGRRSRFQTLLWASLIKLRIETVVELNHRHGLECIEIPHNCVATIFKDVQSSPVIRINATGQSVWNPAAVGLGHGGRGLLSRRLEEGVSCHRVDELVGNRWRISVHMQPRPE